jgi:hypothetical protein
MMGIGSVEILQLDLPPQPFAMMQLQQDLWVEETTDVAWNWMA